MKLKKDQINDNVVFKLLKSQESIFNFLFNYDYNR